MMPIHPLTPEQVVQKSVDSYNSRDIKRFMETFSPDIALYSYREQEPTLEGLDALQTFYQKLFDASPALHATILKRIIFNNKVIDHERIVGRLGSDAALEIVVIYEINDSKIFRLTAIRS
ncbi:MAG TPA: nuclear transport factor 2 family protein [Chryseolinea sp.]